MRDFVFLAFLSQIVDLPIAALDNLSAFSNLVLQTRPLILEPYSNLPDLSVNHALPLRFHHITKLLQLFCFAFVQGRVPVPPFFDLQGQFGVLLFLGFVFLFQGVIVLLETHFQGLVFVVEGLANFTQLVDLIPILLAFSLQSKALLSELPNLHLIILIIKKLPLIFLNPNPQHLNLIRQPLNLNRLEHNNKLQILPKISLLIVRQVLNPRSMHNKEIHTSGDRRQMHRNHSRVKSR